MKRTDNNLDEMQEQELLKIEHNGCWLAFWLLLASMVAESVISGKLDFGTIAGEWTVFMVLALYLAIACVRRGIWDRRIPMNTKMNVLMSASASIALGIFNGAMIFRNYGKAVGAVAAAVFISAIAFLLCFAALTLAMRLTQKKKAEMEAEPADADEM